VPDGDDLEALERDVEALRRENRILTLKKERAEMRRLNAVLQTSFGSSPSPEDGHLRASTDEVDEGDDSEPEPPRPLAQLRTPSEPTLSDDLPYEQPPPRTRPPSVYTAKSRREYTEFIKTCELTFALSPTAYRDERRKALWASQYISGKAFDAWNRHVGPSDDQDDNWDSFRTIMELALGDPENRGRATWDKYFKAQQGPTQTVAAFESYLLNLIDELGDVGPERARLERFRSGLRPEIEAAVVNNASRGKNWQDLVSLAISIEERQTAKRNPSGKAASKPERASPRTPVNKRARTPENDSAYQLRSGGRKRDVSTVVCYRCKGLGHYANECGSKKPKNPNDEPLGAKGKEKA
jgi:hypothetical protein